MSFFLVLLSTNKNLLASLLLAYFALSSLSFECFFSPLFIEKLKDFGFCRIFGMRRGLDLPWTSDASPAAAPRRVPMHALPQRPQGAHQDGFEGLIFFVEFFFGLKGYVFFPWIFVLYASKRIFWSKILIFSGCVSDAPLSLRIRWNVEPNANLCWVCQARRLHGFRRVIFESIF